MASLLNQNKRKRGRILIVAVLFVVYAITATLLFGTACPFSLIFGMPCPSCGITRAHLYFFAFKFEDAFAMHPLFLLSVPAAVCLIASIFKPSVIRHKAVQIAIYAAIAALLICYVVRMILLFPHTSPLDYNEDCLLQIILSWIFG